LPNRIIKESICTSDSIDQLSAFHETVFYRLIVNCDDYGRCDARPKILASKLFPLKDIRANQMEDALRALTSAELVTLYEVGGKPFLQMNTWDRHQTVRAKKSKYPAPDGQLQTSASNCKQLQADASKCSRNPIQSNPNTNTESETNQEAKTNTSAQESSRSSRSNDPELAKVMSFFLDRINPTPSQMCIEDLKSYTASLGADVVLHAFGIALDSRKLDFRYIRGILQSYERDGLKNMEAVLEAEQRHDLAKKQQSQPQKLKQSESYDLRYMVEWPEGSGQWQDMRTIPGYDKR